MLVDPDTGEIRRHAIISCIDVFTRRVKFLVSRTSSVQRDQGAGAQLHHRLGQARAVKTDNGKDYLAHDLEFALRP
jgi:putative transposase